MGPGLLGGFSRALSAVGLADLGKRRRVAAFRADSACETAQKLWAGFAGCKGWGGRQRVCLARGVSRARTGGRRYVHFRTRLRPLFMYDCNRTSRRHARLMRGSLRVGRAALFPPTLAVKRRQGAPGSSRCAVARKNGVRPCPMRCASVWLLEKSAGYEREQR